ncbi:MAG TPA: SCO1664 family protein [Chloroflexi bacterium]|nr:SCO1664 family protein [Chloroflexota bacterium]HBY08881.1 SCO1664 family protein [Chloroflexota bacterium]
MSTLTFEQILHLLQTAEITVEGEFVHGYNYTFLVKVTPEEGEPFYAVYKPQQGEQPLWDFPDNTLAQRETAAFLVSQALGWELVPPTVYRADGPFGAGSVQLYIDHDPEHHYFNFTAAEFQALRPVVLFDLLINNADRKGGHMLFDENGHLWLIDHGLCFNVDEKLRTVIWDFAGDPIPEALCAALKAFRQKLNPPSDLRTELEKHLAPEEITALIERTERLLPCTHFPHPPQDRRAYPFPPV